MPANLTPQYHDAEKKYKALRDPAEKLEALEEMIRLLPKHKGTDHMLADLRRKRSTLKKEAAKAKKKGHKGVSYRIPSEGGGQVVLLGAANAGKSSLLASLTHATPEVADFPFTTQEPVPGMMYFEDAPIQLIDTPAITADFMFSWMVEVVRSADAVLWLADLASDDALDDLLALRARLSEKKTELVPALTGEHQDVSIKHLKTLLVGHKSDADGAADRLAIIEELLEDDFETVTCSSKTGDGLEALKARIYGFLDVIRIYTKVPGQKADLGEPFVIPRGGTVIDLARVVHREMAEGLKNARLWGEGVYDGQHVKRDHVLHDKDIIELHI